MLTLHDTTNFVRVFLKWTSIVIGALFGIYLLILAARFIGLVINPPKPIPPSVEFGKLPPQIFPPNVVNKSFMYSLNTKTGKLPEFSDRAKVYQIEQHKPNLLALQRAQKKAENVGFSIGGQLTRTRYQWSTNIPPFKDLAMDILTYNFQLSSRFLSDPEVLSAKNLPNEKGAIDTATSFLETLQIFPDDIDAEKTKATLLEIQNSELVGAIALSSSQVIRVDYYQKNLDELPIYYPEPPFSSMSFFIGSSATGADVVRANFFHQKALEEKTPTYPIKTAEQAYNTLKEGKAHIVSYYGTNPEIIISDVFLAYYFQNQKQEYVMPIIVFAGNDGFFAYVPAITDEWIDATKASAGEFDF